MPYTPKQPNEDVTPKDLDINNRDASLHVSPGQSTEQTPDGTSHKNAAPPHTPIKSEAGEGEMKQDTLLQNPKIAPPSGPPTDKQAAFGPKSAQDSRLVDNPRNTNSATYAPYPNEAPFYNSQGGGAGVSYAPYSPYPENAAARGSRPAKRFYGDGRPFTRRTARRTLSLYPVPRVFCASFSACGVPVYPFCLFWEYGA